MTYEMSYAPEGREIMSGDGDLSSSMGPGHVGRRGDLKWDCYRGSRRQR